MNRKEFILGSAATLSLAGNAGNATAAQNAATKLHVGTNTYQWGVFYKREGKEFVLHTDEALADIAKTGITGYEPAINAPEEFNGLGARLKAHGLEMRSIYVNSLLHEEAAAKTSQERILTIARLGAEIGTKIIVTNPSPLKWGGEALKTDAQLITQAKALDSLGAELAKLGVSLAYHNHDVELKAGAREFHHMLTATDPANVKFCLDLHWVFRGCGDSQVALLDAIQHYGSRIVELHLRQSKGGKWTEVFTAEGDIDYLRAAKVLRDLKISPHLVLEQAVEAGSPNTMTCDAAHKASLASVLAIFG